MTDIDIRPSKYKTIPSNTDNISQKFRKNTQHIHSMLVSLCLFQYMLTVYYSSVLRRLSCLWRQTCSTLSTSSLTQLDMTMKRWVDSKQYRQALDLFEQQPTHRTNVSINMAIKACTAINDYQRGTDIIQHLSLFSMKNPFIQTSLIRFYSKSTCFLDFRMYSSLRQERTGLRMTLSCSNDFCEEFSARWYVLVSMV